MSLGWGDGTWGANGWGGTLEATGDEATGTVGTVLPDRIVALIGVVTDGLVETITNGGVVVELTGNEAYGNAGYVDVPLSPLTADGFVGSVSAERTVSLTGAASSGSVGNQFELLISALLAVFAGIVMRNVAVQVLSDPKSKTAIERFAFVTL